MFKRTLFFIQKLDTVYRKFILNFLVKCKTQYWNTVSNNSASWIYMQFTILEKNEQEFSAEWSKLHTSIVTKAFQVVYPTSITQTIFNSNPCRGNQSYHRSKSHIQSEDSVHMLGIKQPKFTKIIKKPLQLYVFITTKINYFKCSRCNKHTK